jgi:hypothetical protein
LPGRPSLIFKQTASLASGIELCKSLFIQLIQVANNGEIRMAGSKKISILFQDVGGILLTNGWDRHARQRAIEKFYQDGEEVNGVQHMDFQQNK